MAAPEDDLGPVVRRDKYGRQRRMTDDEMRVAVAQGMSVLGDSYPVKDELKSIGCSWCAAAKCWVAPTEAVLKEARKIVARGPLVEDEVGETMGFAEIKRALKLAGTSELVSEIRRRGVSIVFGSQETLADAVAGYPPTIDDFAGAFDWSKFVGSTDEKDEGR